MQRRYWGEDNNSLIAYFNDRKNKLSLDEVEQSRDKKKTKELLNNLDSYSLEDIRNKYMKEKIEEGDNYND